ncbi:MAG: vWA domain-containing protein [Rudaea sp.]
MQGQGHDPKPSPRPADRIVPIGDSFKPQKLQTPLDKMARNKAGKRSRTRTERKRGRYIRAREMNGDVSDVAFDATFRSAAPHQLRRGRSDVALAIESQDLRQKVRVRRAANLILFVVDASWSMAAAERMIATKGAIMSLLVDAYQKRDRVGLVVFQKEEARTVLPPTSSVELAQKALREIPVGGKTPLSAGLLLAHQILIRERMRDPQVMPLMIVVTDGAGNVSMTDLPPQEEAHRIAGMIHKTDLRSIVINTEHEAFDRGLAAMLADKLGGPVYTLKELRAEELYAKVRENLLPK